MLSTYYVGTKTGSSVSQTVTNTVSGAGTLLLNNLNNELNVRQFWQAGGGAHYAVMSIAGLDNFTANLGRIRVGDGEAQPVTRAEGQLILAKTNTITLTGTGASPTSNWASKPHSMWIASWWAGESHRVTFHSIPVSARRR